MTTIQQTSVFNVEASLNKHMETELVAITKPSWLSSYTLYETWPEKSPSLPAFSINHINVGFDDVWEGRGVGGSYKGLAGTQILEVNAWVTRKSRNWIAQLRTMVDMVMTVIGRTTEVVIKDYAADLSSPSNTTYLIRIDDVQVVETAPDPNPDIERKRILITYSWVYRSV